MFAAFGFIIWLAQPADQSVNQTASAVGSLGQILSSDMAYFDFGEISMANGKVSHKFNVKNVGSSGALLTKLYTSCMCTTAELLMADQSYGPFGMPGHGFSPKMNVALDVGEEVGVEVIFDPNAHGPAGVGRIDRKIYLENNLGSPLELAISATVIP